MPMNKINLIQKVKTFCCLTMIESNGKAAFLTQFYIKNKNNYAFKKRI